MARQKRSGYCTPVLFSRLLILNCLPIFVLIGVLDEGCLYAFFGCSACAMVIDFILHRQGLGLLGFWVTCLMVYTIQLAVLMRSRLLGDAQASPKDELNEAAHTPMATKLKEQDSSWTRGSSESGSMAASVVVPELAGGRPVFGGRLSQSHPIMHTMSVVLPCADERDNALKTVERFCERTPLDILKEIIVVDDGSTPPLSELFASDSRQLLKSKRCNVRIVRHELTIGLMAAKLTGGKAALGDVIGFFDCHVAPQLHWEREIMQKIQENPRRMVVPAITDLDMDTFDEKVNSAVNAKCYLTFDADFKWFDDESDYVPTISGGLAAMSREWFNLTGGFDEQMHGWGGENLDQSLRMWQCGGEIMRAKSSRIAHMWRVGDPRTRAHYSVKAKGTDNRGRVVSAWYDAFIPFYRGHAVPREQTQNYESFKHKLACKPFSYFLYRFRKMYVEGGVIPREEFLLREKSTGLCLTGHGMGTAGSACDAKNHKQVFQQGNVDQDAHPGKCCSGIRQAQSNNCLDFFNENGANWYSCDLSGKNANQHYRFRKDGRIVKGIDNPKTCLYLKKEEHHAVQKKPCDELTGDVGIWERIHAKETRLYETYLSEVAKHGYAEEFPDLPDN